MTETKLKHRIMSNSFLNILSQDNYWDILCCASFEEFLHYHGVSVGVEWKVWFFFLPLQSLRFFTPLADLLGSKLLFACGGGDLKDYGIFWLLWKRHHGIQKSKNGWVTHIKIRAYYFPPLGKEDREAFTLTTPSRLWDKCVWKTFTI